MDKNYVKEDIINLFLKENFKNEANILLFGSNKEGHNKNSDIDILIISNYINSFIKETYLFKDYLFDVIILPKSEIHTYLERDKYIKVYVDILTKGKIILDKDNVLKKIINEINRNIIPEDAEIRKIQVEKNISFLMGKMSTSKTIYEAEIFFNKVSENIYTRRLLDFGICNIESTKHLVNRILDLDFQLVDVIYKLKKNLMRHQNVSIILTELFKLLNLNNFWSKDYYSNKYVLSKIYEDKIVVFIANNYKIINEFDGLIQKHNIVFYSFLIDENNINKEGKYYVIIEKEHTITTKLIPLFEKKFFENENLLINDSKIIFPYQIDIQSQLGILNDNTFKKAETLLLLINQIKNKKIDGLIFYIIFQILKQISSKVVVENLIYTFAGKSTILKNNSHLNESINTLIDLKNRYFDTKISISSKEIKLYKETIENINVLFPSDTKFLNDKLSELYDLISDENSSIMYSVTNLIFNMFDVKDYQKPYIITIIKKMSNNES